MRVATGPDRHRGRTLARAAAVATAAAVAIGLVGAMPPAAAAPDQYAPSIGTVTGLLQTGPTNVPLGVRGSVPCPDGSTVVNGFVNSTAAGITDGIAISANSTDVGNLAGSGMPLDNNLLGIAQSAGRVLVNGRYELSVVCYPDAFSTPTAQLDGAFTVSGGTTPTAPGTTVTWDVAGPAATTTSLAASPAATAVAGDPVTLTATVTPTAAAGTVQFVDVASGSPVNVGPAASVSGGSASVTTTSLAEGAHSLLAVFTPADASAFSSSTSGALAYTITPAQQEPTTTTTSLAASPAATAAAGDPVILTASVTPAAAAGTVQFVDVASGSPVNVGAAVPVSGGSASVTTTSLAVGSRSLQGVFTPADASAYEPSTSGALAYAITEPSQEPAATTTSLSASPAATAAAGDPVTFTAVVAPAQAAGSVRFADTATGTSVPLGGPVAVAGGTATLTTASLGVGQHSVTAEFVPADATAHAPSTSAALDYTITEVAPAAKATRTKLAAFPLPSCGGWGWWGWWSHHAFRGKHVCPTTKVLLFAQVRPAAAGTMRFYATTGGVKATVGGPVKVGRRWPTTVRTRLRPGTHRLTAVFTPDDPAAYRGSTSNVVTVKVPERRRQH